MVMYLSSTLPYFTLSTTGDDDDDYDGVTTCLLVVQWDGLLPIVALESPITRYRNR